MPTLVIGRAHSLVEMGYVHEVISALRVVGVANVSLFMPYFPGGRSDRVFDTDELVMPQGIDMYVNIVKSANPDKVFVLDAHSSKTLIKIGATGIELNPALAVKYAADKDFFGSKRPVAVIAPDKGAKQRADRVASMLCVPVFNAEKTRNEATGRLSGFVAPHGVPEGLSIVVDDICDGGGTFAGLHDAFMRKYPYYRDLALFVTHGVFSGNYAENLKDFRPVVTTDSFIHDTTYKRVPISLYYPIIAKEMTK